MLGSLLFSLPKVRSSNGVLGRTPINFYTALGAKVIAAAGSEAKLDIAKRYGGADHAIDYSKAGWQKEVLKLTNGKGVDVIYDPVGLINGAF